LAAELPLSVLTSVSTPVLMFAMAPPLPSVVLPLNTLLEMCARASERIAPPRAMTVLLEKMELLIVSEAPPRQGTTTGVIVFKATAADGERPETYATAPPSFAAELSDRVLLLMVTSPLA
jgi:hypothetical protein